MKKERQKVKKAAQEEAERKEEQKNKTWWAREWEIFVVNVLMIVYNSKDYQHTTKKALFQQVKLIIDKGGNTSFPHNWYDSIIFLEVSWIMYMLLSWLS